MKRQHKAALLKYEFSGNSGSKVPTVHSKIRYDITKEWKYTQQGLDGSQIYDQSNPNLETPDQGRQQSLDQSKTSVFIRKDPILSQQPNTSNGFDGIPRPPKKLPLDRYIERVATGPRRQYGVGGRGELRGGVLEKLPPSLYTLFEWRESAAKVISQRKVSVGRTTEDELNSIADESEELLVRQEFSGRKRLLRKSSNRLGGTVGDFSLLKNCKTKIYLTSSNENTQPASKSLEIQKHKEMETLFLLNRKFGKTDDRSRYFETRPSEKFLAEMSYKGIHSPAGISHHNSTARLLGNFECLQTSNNEDEAGRYFLNLRARSFNHAQKEQLKTFYKYQAESKHAQKLDQSQTKLNATLKDLETSILASVGLSRSNILVSLPHPALPVPDPDRRPNTQPTDGLLAHLVAPNSSFNDYYAVRPAAADDEDRSEDSEDTVATHKTRIKLGQQVGMKLRRNRAPAGRFGLKESADTPDHRSIGGRSGGSKVPSLHSKSGLIKQLREKLSDDDDEVDEEERRDRMSHLDRLSEEKKSRAEQSKKHKSAMKSGETSEKTSEADSEEEKSSSDKEEGLSFRGKRNEEPKPVVKIRRLSGSGIDITKPEKTPRDSDDATSSNKADSSNSNIFLYMDERKPRQQAGHQKILSPLVQIKQSTRRGADKLVSQKSFDSGSNKKGGSRKFGDPASSVSSYINPGGEYVSFWMTCINNCLEQKSLEKFENIGFSETFNTTIAKQTAAQLAGNRMSQQGGARLTGRNVVFPPPEAGRGSRTALTPGTGPTAQRFTHRRTLFVQAPKFQPRVIPDRMELAHHLVISIMEKLSLLNWLDTEREDKILQCHHLQGSSRDIYNEIRSQANVLTFTNSSGEEVPGYATSPAKVEPGQMVEIDFELSKYIAGIEAARIERLRTKTSKDYDRELMNFDGGLVLAEETEEASLEDD